MTQEEMAAECLRLAALPEKPTLNNVRPLIKVYYQGRGSQCGCCNHIVLEDPNQEDSAVEHCIESAKENGHEDCEAVGRLLLRLSFTQRTKLYRWWGKYDQ